jgi:uncharacterized membrane protein YfcA
MLDTFLVALIIFFGIFVQSVTGFGLALVAMPLLATMVGLVVAAPLIALIAMVNRVMMIFYYREHFDFHEIWRLMLASVLGIGIASLLFSHAGESHAFEILLGFIIVGYALLNIINPRFPRLEETWWAYPFGIASGILARLYNVGGPPAIMYANGRNWPPAQFKTNLQAFALISSALVLLARVANGEYTMEVMRYFWVSLPPAVLALVAGVFLDRYINPIRFRRVILMLLVIIGFSLIF